MVFMFYGQIEAVLSLEISNNFEEVIYFGLTDL